MILILFALEFKLKLILIFFNRICIVHDTEIYTMIETELPVNYLFH